jgi:hypothetical protein
VNWIWLCEDVCSIYIYMWFMSTFYALHATIRRYSIKTWCWTFSLNQYSISFCHSFPPTFSFYVNIRDPQNEKEVSGSGVLYYNFSFLFHFNISQVFSFPWVNPPVSIKTIVSWRHIIFFVVMTKVQSVTYIWVALWDLFPLFLALFIINYFTDSPSHYQIKRKISSF